MDAELTKSLSEKSNQELFEILENPADWRPEVVEFARSELERRPISKAEIAQATPERGTQKKAHEPLTFSESFLPVLLGALLGLLGAFLLWLLASHFKTDGYNLKYKRCWRLYWIALGTRFAVMFLIIIIFATLSH